MGYLAKYWLFYGPLLNLFGPIIYLFLLIFVIIIYIYLAVVILLLNNDKMEMRLTYGRILVLFSFLSLIVFICFTRYKRLNYFLNLSVVHTQITEIISFLYNYIVIEYNIVVAFLLILIIYLLFLLTITLFLVYMQAIKFSYYCLHVSCSQYLFYAAFCTKGEQLCFYKFNNILYKTIFIYLHRVPPAIVFSCFILEHLYYGQIHFFYTVSLLYIFYAIVLNFIEFYIINALSRISIRELTNYWLAPQEYDTGIFFSWQNIQKIQSEYVEENKKNSENKEILFYSIIFNLIIFLFAALIIFKFNLIYFYSDYFYLYILLFFFVFFCVVKYCFKSRTFFIINFYYVFSCFFMYVCEKNINHSSLLVALFFISSFLKIMYYILLFIKK